MATRESAGRARAASGPALTPGRLAALRLPAYRWFLTAQTCSSLGDFVVAPALAFAVLDLTGSAGDLGLVLAARTVPIILFMLLGGVIADRLPRHRVMLGADVVRMLGQGVMAGLVFGGQAAVWQLMALQAVHGTASAMFTPAVSRLVQEIVPESRRPSANALRSMSHSATMIAGPLLAALLVVTAGAGPAMVLDAVTFGVSALCLSRLRLPRTGPAPAAGPGRLVGELREGWLEFRSRSWVWSIISVASLANMLYATFTVLGPGLSEQRFGGRGAWGVLLAAFGAGAVLGGAAALWLRPRRPLRAATLALSLFAAPPLALAAGSPGLPATAAAVLLGGVGLMLFNSLWETALQAEIPPGTLSRVSAYEWLGSYAAQPVGLTLAGTAAAHAGTRTTLLCAGLAQLVIGFAPLALRDVRELRARDR
ncbi:MFS transporter [Streptomyces polychromogenes]|nr:MFS transporter [Streptomyces polychromogenes]